MAQTTTHQNACDVVIQLDNDSNVLQDISGSSNEASMAFANDIGELTVFGAQFKNKLVCKTSVTFNLSVVYSTAAAEARALFDDWQFNNLTTNRTLQLNVPDNEIGSFRYQSETALESYDIPLVSGEAAPIIATIVLQNDGAVTQSTIAT